MRSAGPWVVTVVLASLIVPARARADADEPGPAAPSAGPVRLAASARLPPDPASVFAPAPDRADGAARGDASFAFAVNAPWAWLRNNIGASAYVAVDPHWAMRANIARYDAEQLLPLLATGGEGPIYHGAILDLGLGWIWYPRRLWDGFMFEAGALMRDRDVRRIREDDPDLNIQTTTYAARAMIGWSWLAARAVFLSAAIGVSAGLEHGYESAGASGGAMATARALDRRQIDFETYVRVGFAFGR